MDSDEKVCALILVVVLGMSECDSLYNILAAFIFKYIFPQKSFLFVLFSGNNIKYPNWALNRLTYLLTAITNIYLVCGIILYNYRNIIK